jgi:pyrroline-5-carboxylate reductase
LNMSLKTVSDKGLVLLGCGKMGSALLQGWLADGLLLASVSVLEPYPSDWLLGLADQGLQLNTPLPKEPAVCVIAVKPQMMGTALPDLQEIAQSDAVFLSIAAGTPISNFQSILGESCRIVRAMPNTPAAIGQGITALIGNETASLDDVALCETLLQAVGDTVVLETEQQMDAVTAVSGSGPAYVFHLIETLAAAGAAQGLPANLAMTLAKKTVSGSGALAMMSEESPEQLRINVTSPGGTTQAALEVLMNPQTGFPNVLKRGVEAATKRSEELGES